LAYAEHHNREVVSFQKITGIFHEWKANGSSKATEIYTHVSKKQIGIITNPLDDFGQPAKGTHTLPI
jgi:hypothetical protein